MRTFLSMKALVFSACLVPLVWIAWDFASDAMAEPVAVTMNRLGFWALTVLCLSLACTPAKTLLKWTWPNKLRRMLGLFAFFYASLHFLFYVIIDQELELEDIGSDIVKRKFITVGLLAFLCLLPLAVTSTQKMVKRLGFRRWKTLHRLTYVASGLGVVHFMWRVKADYREPIIFAAVLGVLLMCRMIVSWQRRRRAA